jgi:hypothetical protein
MRAERIAALAFFCGRWLPSLHLDATWHRCAPEALMLATCCPGGLTQRACRLGPWMHPAAPGPRPNQLLVECKSSEARAFRGQLMLHQKSLDPVVVTLLEDAISVRCCLFRHMKPLAESLGKGPKQGARKLADGAMQRADRGRIEGGSAPATPGLIPPSYTTCWDAAPPHRTRTAAPPLCCRPSPLTPARGLAAHRPAVSPLQCTPLE